MYYVCMYYLVYDVCVYGVYVCVNLCVCVSAGMHTSWHTCGNQETTWVPSALFETALHVSPWLCQTIWPVRLRKFSCPCLPCLCRNVGSQMCHSVQTDMGPGAWTQVFLPEPSLHLFILLSFQKSCWGAVSAGTPLWLQMGTHRCHYWMPFLIKAYPSK